MASARVARLPAGAAACSDAVEQAPSPGLARRRRVSRRSSEPRRSGYPASTSQLHPLLVQLAAMRLVAVLMQQLLSLPEPDVLLPDLRCGVGPFPYPAVSRRGWEAALARAAGMSRLHQDV